MESQKSSTKPTRAPESSAKSESDEVLGPTVIGVLKDIWRELKTIRQLNSEMARFMRDAESEVPESYRRFLNAFHDMHDIKYMNEEHGVDPPPYVLREIERFYDRLRQIVEAGNAEGGHLNKIRREMASDPNNRYDHTRLLERPKENGSETGKSK